MENLVPGCDMGPAETKRDLKDLEGTRKDIQGAGGVAYAEAQQ